MMASHHQNTIVQRPVNELLNRAETRNAGESVSSTGSSAEGVVKNSCCAKFSHCVVVCSPLWLLLCALIYPAIFIPVALNGLGIYEHKPWPIKLQVDFQAYIKSDTQPSRLDDAVSLAVEGALGRPEGSIESRRLNQKEDSGRSWRWGDPWVEIVRPRPRPYANRDDAYVPADIALEPSLWHNSPRRTRRELSIQVVKGRQMTRYMTVHAFFLDPATNSDEPGTNGNVMTREKLRRIKEIENAVMALPGYSDICAATSKSDRRCASRTRDAVTNFFFPTIVQPDKNEPNMLQAIIPDGEGELIGLSNTCEVPKDKMPNPPADATLTKDGAYYTLSGIDCVLNSFIEEGIVHYTDKFFNERHRYSAVTRSDFVFALPIGGAGYKDAFDNTAAQISVIKTFLKEKMYPLLVESSSTGVDGVRVLWWNDELKDHELSLAVLHDSSLAGLAFCFVFVFMWFSTRSLFLTMWAMVGIMYSFPLTYVIFTAVVGYKEKVLRRPLPGLASVDARTSFRHATG